MRTQSRREWIFNAVYGLGGLTLTAKMPGGGIFATPALADAITDPLSPKQPHFPPKVKSVIWLHMDGAPSTLDLFDYKPELIKLAGQDVPPSFLNGIKTSTQGGVGKLFVSNRTWKQYGESGAWFSDLLPNLAQHADKLAFIKSSTTIGATHDISILKLNTGDTSPGRPSLGAWVTYALGSANPDLPAYVVLCRGKKEPQGGSVNWSSGFLPAIYQRTAFRPGNSPILHLDHPELIGQAEQRDDLDLLKHLNAQRAALYPDNTELEARLRSYELAYRMESTAPEAVDLSKESDATKALYGLELRSIVAPPTTLMAFCYSKLTGCSPVRTQIIHDELVWDKAIFLQKLAHQFERRPLVASGLDENVENFTLGIRGRPQIDHRAIDFQPISGPSRSPDGQSLRTSAASATHISEGCTARQILPLINSRISSAVLAWPSAISPTAEQICPGVQ
jgi:hypothetical protein